MGKNVERSDEILSLLDSNPTTITIKVMLNDQFKAAWKRPNLVVVEAVMPKSEIEGAYKAPYAALPAGEHKWNNGRSLFLSRWSKIVRIVPFAEVAADIDRYWRENPSAYKGAKVTDYDRFQPQVREALERLGYRFEDKGNRGSLSDAEREKAYKSENAIYITDEDIERMNAEMTQDWRETPANELTLATQPKNEKEAERLVMLDRVETLSEKLNTPIRIITKESELEAVSEDGKPRYSRREKRAKGWWSARTGEVVVVLPNNVNVADVENTVVHEVVGHKGLRAFIGEERFDEFLGEVYGHASNPIKKKIDGIAKGMAREYADRLSRDKQFLEECRKEGEAEIAPGSPLANALGHAESERRRKAGEYNREATEEYMADLGGRIGDEGFEKMSRDELTLWGKIKAKVQGFLDKFLRGLKIAKGYRLTDKDLSYILFKSWKMAREGKSSLRSDHNGGGIFAEAEDAVRRLRSGFDDMMTVSEKHARIQKLRKSVPVEISGREIQYSPDMKIYKRNAIEYGKKLQGEYLNNDTGKAIRLQRGRHNGGLKEILQHDLSEEAHIQSIAALPEIINNAIYIETRPNMDPEKNPDVTGYEHYVCGLRIGGEDYTVHSIVASDKDGNRYYDHKLSHIEKGKLLDFIEAKQPDGQILTPMSGTEPTIRSQRKIKELISLLQIEDDGANKRFRDPSLDLEATITKMKTDAAEANADDLAARDGAMRAIGGNLRHLRRAMARQREYDVATAKSVKDLARTLMEHGLLDSLGNAEVKSLLSQVTNAIGRKDISGQVERVMEIMTDNTLRRAEAAFGKLVSMRTSRADGRGIKVAGALDPDGERILKTFNAWKHVPAESRDAKGELADGCIDARMAKVMEAMNDQYAPVAERATLEYAGLQIAREYAENIGKSKQAEKELRAEIKEAREEKAAGRMTAAAFAQFETATRDAIEQLKLDRIGAYAALTEKLGGEITESVERAKAWRQAQKERIGRIHHLANSDMQGRELRGDKKDTRLMKLRNSWLASWLLAPMSSLDQMLKMFGSKNPNGEGYLYNHFMHSWADSADREQVMKEEIHKLMDEKAAEIFGKRRALRTGYTVPVDYTYSDLYDYAGALPKATIKYHDGAEMRYYEIDQGTLLYLYAVEKMPMGRATNRRMGIEEAMMQTITDALDPKLKEYAGWVQDELLPRLGDRANEVHRRMFGADMDAIENYFPFVRDKNALKREEENGQSTLSNDRVSVQTGAIKKRVPSVAKWDMRNANFLDVLARHVDEMTHWSAFAELNRDFGTLLSYNRFKQQVFSMTSVYGAGEKLWKRFAECCAIATDCYEPKRSDFDRTMVTGAKGMTMSKIAFRPFTALKQTLSLPAFAGEVDYATVAADVATGGVIACRRAWQNMPNYRKRILSRTAGDYRLRETEYDTKIMKAASYGMLPNIGVDAWTIAVGAHAVYKAKKAKYLRWGLDESEADARAIRDAELCYNKSQQSSEGPFMAPVQVDHTFWSTTAMLFRNASTLYTREAHASARNLKRLMSGEVSEEYVAKQILRTVHPEAEGAWTDAQWAHARKQARREIRTAYVKNIVNLAVFGWALPWLWRIGGIAPLLLLSGDDDEKDKQWEDATRQTMFGPIEGLAYGDVIEEGLNYMLPKVTDKKLYQIGRENPIFSDIKTALKKADKDMISAANDLINIIVGTATGVNPQTATDWIVAIIDATDDRDTQIEMALFACRLLNVPQSQLDKLYLEELDMDALEASGRAPAELISRYSRYKAMRESPLTGWMRTEEDAAAVAERKGAAATGAAKESLAEGTDARAEVGSNVRMAEVMADYEAVKKRLTEIRKLKGDDEERYWSEMDALQDDPRYGRYIVVRDYKREVDELTKEWIKAETPAERDSCAQAIIGLKKDMLKEVHE